MFGSTKKLIGKTNNEENNEAPLVQYNLAGNKYQKKSQVLYTFRFNKSYTYLLNVEASNLVSDFDID